MTIRERLALIAMRGIEIATLPPLDTTDLEKLVALRNEVEEVIDQIERQLEREA